MPYTFTLKLCKSIIKLYYFCYFRTHQSHASIVNPTSKFFFNIISYTSHCALLVFGNFRISITRTACHSGRQTTPHCSHCGCGFSHINVCVCVYVRVYCGYCGITIACILLCLSDVLNNER